MNGILNHLSIMDDETMTRSFSNKFLCKMFFFFLFFFGMPPAFSSPTCLGHVGRPIELIVQIRSINLNRISLRRKLWDICHYLEKGRNDRWNSQMESNEQCTNLTHTTLSGRSPCIYRNRLKSSPFLFHHLFQIVSAKSSLRNFNKSKYNTSGTIY